MGETDETSAETIKTSSKEGSSNVEESKKATEKMAEDSVTIDQPTVATSNDEEIAADEAKPDEPVAADDDKQPGADIENTEAPSISIEKPAEAETESERAPENTQEAVPVDETEEVIPADKAEDAIPAEEEKEIPTDADEAKEAGVETPT